MSSTPITDPGQPDDALAGKLKRTQKVNGHDRSPADPVTSRRHRRARGKTSTR